MKYCLLFIIVGLSFSLEAQNSGSLGGKILDAELYNEPLLMANVGLKGTTWSTQTNFNGNFEITDITPGDYILQVNFLGYEQLEVLVSITVGERLDILKSLRAKTFQLPSDAVIASKEVAQEASKDPVLRK